MNKKEKYKNKKILPSQNNSYSPMKTKATLLFLVVTLVLTTVAVAAPPVWFEWVDSHQQQRPVFKYETVVVATIPELCTYRPVNETFMCTPEHNITRVQKTLIKYEYDTIIDKKRGLTVNGKNYEHPVHIKGDFLSQWSVPVGERNYEEFGQCRDYEVAKGVCTKEDVST